MVSMRPIITLVLVALLASLQYRLWWGKHSIQDYYRLQKEVDTQILHNAGLEQRNKLLKADIQDLQLGVESIEERARNELGLIKEGETFYRILPAEN
jgi:cell division protein FtsB